MKLIKRILCSDRALNTMEGIAIGLNLAVVIMLVTNKIRERA